MYSNYILVSDNGSYKKEILPGKANTGDIIVADFDNDGYDEIITGNRIIPQQYPLSSQSQYFDNKNGEIIFDQSKSDLFSNIGIVNAMKVSDINNDNLPDLIIAAEWEPIRIFINEAGVLKETETGLSNLKGWWYSIEEIDINKDGLVDFVMGNLGENSKYLSLIHI